jgi:protein-disulfide isomerase
MYLVNFTLFISLYLAMRIPFSESFSFLWGYWYTFFTKKKRGIDFMPRVFFHVLISIIVFGIGLVFISSASSNVKRLSAREINGYVSSFYKQSSYDIRFAKDTTPMWGTKGAPVTIVEFSDYRCPFCKVAAFTIKPFLAEHRDNVAYYFLNYPLDSTCNHYMQHQMHPGACLGAKGGICAEKVGKFWEYHDKMFESSERINLELLKKLANRLSIDNSEFVKCVNSAETDLKLKEEIETARRIYVTGTPSVFVNNRHLKYWKSPEVLRKVVESEIKVSKKNN